MLNLSGDIGASFAARAAALAAAKGVPPQFVLMGLTKDCDADLPVVSADDPIISAWDPVTMSQDDLGKSGVSIEVVNYEVVVEIDETPLVTSTILPPSVTSFEVKKEILDLADEIKFEVLVRETSYSQIAVDSCFEIE